MPASCRSHPGPCAASCQGPYRHGPAPHERGSKAAGAGCAAPGPIRPRVRWRPRCCRSPKLSSSWLSPMPGQQSVRCCAHWRGRISPKFFRDPVFCDKVCQSGIRHSPKHISEKRLGRIGLYCAPCKGAPHILIVDDHREIRDLVSRALTKEGFRVSTAADGRAMRKVLADGRIDLILLDLMLPGEDGLSLCRALRPSRTSRSSC